MHRLSTYLAHWRLLALHDAGILTAAVVTVEVAELADKIWMEAFVEGRGLAVCSCPT